VELARPGSSVRVFVDLGSRMQTMLLLLVQHGGLAAHGAAAETVRRILAAFPAQIPTQPEETATGTAQSRSRAANAGLVEPLSGRERDVLALLRDRLSDKEIADRLGLSTATVKRHTANIYGKLGVSKRWDAVVKAEALGVLPAR
jgi:LuxR family maltose regulon positive regulatory protein